MTADHGRRALPWYDRRQPTIVAEAARRAGVDVATDVDRIMSLTGARTGEVVAVVKFSIAGTILRASLFPADTSTHVYVRADDFGITARELADTVVAWLAAGRPADVVPLLPNPFTVTTTDQENRS